MRLQVSVANGSVRFIKGQDESPPSFRRPSPNVTERTEGAPEVPPYYQVTFRIVVEAEGESPGSSFDNDFDISLLVTAADDQESYRSVEDRAARALPDFLRQIADGLQDELDEASARFAAAHGAHGE